MCHEAVISVIALTCSTDDVESVFKCENDGTNPHITKYVTVQR